MTKQVFTANQVLTAAQMNSLQNNDFNWDTSTKTTSYVLLAADAGTRVIMNSASNTTITVNTGLFAAGDVLWIHNINTGTCTVTAGTATVNSAGSLALAQWEGGALYFTSASSAIFFRAGGIGYGVATGGSSSSITVGGVNYTMLTFTSSSTLTVTKAGLFDVLLVGGGGGSQSATSYGGGGGGGDIVEQTVYLSANATVTIGAGGASTARFGATSRLGTAPAITAVGGGTGGGTQVISDRAVFSGGCGGGGQGTGNATVALGAAGMNGGNGGNGQATDNQGGGGGGGYAANGSNGSGTAGGNGGAGRDVSTFRGEASSTTFYAGGGGGGGASGGTGGSGGGGNRGSAGSANTGGGGGGASSAGGAGSAGGSGIVLVRFKV